MKKPFGAVIVSSAFLASLVATTAPAAGTSILNGPPGTTLTKTSALSLSGTFAGFNSKGSFSFTTSYSSWVANSAGVTSELTGAIAPSAGTDGSLTALGAVACTLRLTSIKVSVGGLNPPTVNLAYEAGPITSPFPLQFNLPQLYLGALQAPSTGSANITAKLVSLTGTVSCVNGSGGHVAVSSVASYKPVKSSSSDWLSQTTYGIPPPPGIISGTVTDNTTQANPVAGATVEVCGSEYQCTPATTASDGSYSESVAPGQYIVIVAPPTTITNLNRGDAGQFTVTSNATTTGNVVLDVRQPLPPGVTMNPNTGHPPTVPPTEYWNLPFTLTALGCPNGTATWQVQGWNVETPGYETLTGPMTESPAGSGVYTGNVPALNPIHGPVRITITIHCPDGSTQTIPFDAYIDPSGTVVDQNGNPVAGATVTLFWSTALSGPWTQVPNGDTSFMSPSNTSNPDTTGSAGQFGWDTIADDYRLTAKAPGCTTDTTPGFSVPPPQLGIILTLTCKKRALVTASALAQPHR